jgi:hypothetical protein
MDFAFVPGIGDPALERLADLIKRLPDTVVDLSPQPAALSEFFSVVDSVIQNLSLGPAGNLLIGAHGEEEGNWYLALDRTAPIPAVYETIEKSTSIRIPPGVMGPLTWVRLKSCLLGEINPLLQVLKKALGNPPAVTAPRYIHTHVNGLLGGIWEFMTYQFVVIGSDSGKLPLPDRKAAKAAFADPGNHFQLIDTSIVPTTLWESWIPPAGSLNLAPTTVSKATDSFFVSVPNFFGSGIAAFLKFETRFFSTLESVPMLPFESDFIPGDRATILDSLNQFLGTRLEYQDTHPYPVFKRYGHKNLTDFTNGFKWTVTDSPGKTKTYSLQYVGTRYRYRLEVPITKPGTNELIYNFYPDSGASTINFSETNDPFRFFGRV